MIEFPKSILVESCEKLLRKIRENNLEELVLPVETTKHAFAGISSAIQAAITWGRQPGDHILHLKKCTKDLDYQINETINRPHKFVAAMFANKIIFQDDNGLKDIRSYINANAKINIENQSASGFGQQHGHLCWFAFVDHSSKGFDRNFYISEKDEKPHPRNESQIQSVIYSMVKKSASVAGGGSLPSSDEVEYLGRLFYELFINTHEHGTRNINRSEWLKPAVRVIYTYGINLTKLGAGKLIKSEPALSGYIKTQDENSRYIEISIIDSGIGYFERWLSDRPNENSAEKSLKFEYEIFKKCFTFRQSSSGRDHKGNGLPVVMEKLTNLKGFMRVRSGRLSFFRNFEANPYVHGDTCEFYDWYSLQCANERITPCERVEGVAITLLIPLASKRKKGDAL